MTDANDGGRVMGAIAKYGGLLLVLELVAALLNVLLWTRILSQGVPV